jgi:hypothetical protein
MPDPKPPHSDDRFKWYGVGPVSAGWVVPQRLKSGGEMRILHGPFIGAPRFSPYRPGFPGYPELKINHSDLFIDTHSSSNATIRRSPFPQHAESPNIACF